MEFIPKFVSNNYKWVALGLLVLGLIILIFIVCWIASKFQKCRPVTNTVVESTLPPVPPLSRIELDSGYVVTSNFSREYPGSIPNGYVSDSFVIDLINETTNITTRLANTSFLLKNYYNRSVIVSNDTVSLAGVSKVTITFTHGASTYTYNTNIISRPSTSAIIIDFPSLWLYFNM